MAAEFCPICRHYVEMTTAGCPRSHIEATLQDVKEPEGKRDYRKEWDDEARYYNNDDSWQRKIKDDMLDEIERLRNLLDKESDLVARYYNKINTLEARVKELEGDIHYLEAWEAYSSGNSEACDCDICKIRKGR